MSSIPGKVPLFHFMMEDGGIWWRMPISAFCSKSDAPKQELIDLVLWDSFSYYPSVTVFEVLKNKKIEYTSRHKEKFTGTYLFTLDWASGDPNNTDHGFSEKPGQHKCGHVIHLDNGNYAIQPNNRIIVRDPSFTASYGKMLIERKINTHEWSVENSPKWITENSDKYYYDIQ
jgi:hypothetical protein